MARLQRNNVDYFPHSVNHGKKMFYLREKYKNDGYAVWFMLLEELGKAEYHYLDLNDKVQIMYLSSSLMVTENVLNEIINILVEFGEFDKKLWHEYSILFNEKFVNNISDAYRKRNNNCVDKNSLLRLLEANGRLNKAKGSSKALKGSSEGDIKPQSKVKYTKVNKSKVEDRKKDFVKQVLQHTQYDDDLLKDFINYWTEENQAKTKMKFEMQKTFAVPNRLSTWKRNEKKFGHIKDNSNKTIFDIHNEANKDRKWNN